MKFISVVEKKEQNLKSIQKIFTNQKTLPSRVCGVRGGEQRNFPEEVSDLSTRTEAISTRSGEHSRMSDKRAFQNEGAV